MKKFRRVICSSAAIVLTLAMLSSGAPLMASAGTWVVLGDMDQDSKVTAMDARTILRASAKLDAPLSERMQRVADVDADGVVTSSDARFVLRASANLERINQPSNPYLVNNAARIAAEMTTLAQAVKTEKIGFSKERLSDITNVKITKVAPALGLILLTDAMLEDMKKELVSPPTTDSWPYIPSGMIPSNGVMSLYDRRFPLEGTSQSSRFDLMEQAKQVKSTAVSYNNGIATYRISFNDEKISNFHDLKSNPTLHHDKIFTPQNLLALSKTTKMEMSESGISMSTKNAELLYTGSYVEYQIDTRNDVDNILNATYFLNWKVTIILNISGFIFGDLKLEVTSFEKQTFNFVAP